MAGGRNCSQFGALGDAPYTPRDDTRRTGQIPRHNFYRFVTPGGPWDDAEEVAVTPEEAVASREAAQAHEEGPPPAAPQRSEEEVLRYFDKNDQEVRERLTNYTKSSLILISNHGHGAKVTKINSVDLKRLDGSKVDAVIGYTYGESVNETHGTFLFKVRWFQGELEILGHEEINTHNAIPLHPAPLRRRGPALRAGRIQASQKKNRIALSPCKGSTL